MKQCTWNNSGSGSDAKELWEQGNKPWENVEKNKWHIWFTVQMAVQQKAKKKEINIEKKLRKKNYMPDLK